MSWHDSHSGKRLARLPPRSRITQTSIAVISERKRCGSALAHRLALVEAIVQSLQFELEPRPQVPKGTLTSLVYSSTYTDSEALN